MKMPLPYQLLIWTIILTWLLMVWGCKNAHVIGPLLAGFYGATNPAFLCTAILTLSPAPFISAGLMPVTDSPNQHRQTIRPTK